MNKEEEKEAIEIVKYFENFTPYIIEQKTLGNRTLYMDYDLMNKINKLLNYIDKLQKKNETLKHDLEVYKNREINAQKACGKLSTLNKKFRKRIKKQHEENVELKEKYENINWYFENQKDNFVHKDKIEVLKELLGDDE